MKTKISKKIGRRGKIGLTVLIAAMFIGIATAGVLTYFGEIKTTANVDQAVVIGSPGDWHNYDDPIEYTIDAIGGDTFCYDQWIWNKASIPVDVIFDTSHYQEITTTYLKGMAGSTVSVTSIDTSGMTDEDAFNNEPETLVLDNVPFDAQTAPVTMEGEVLALDLGNGWVDTAYVEIGVRPESTKDERNAGVYLIAFNVDGDGTWVHLQDYSGNGQSGGVIKIGEDSDFSYKMTLTPSGSTGGTATLEVWVGEVSQGTATLPYGHASTWDEDVAGDFNEDYTSAYLFYSIIADRRGVADQTYSATVGNIKTDSELHMPTIPAEEKLLFYICYTFDLHCEGTYVLTTLIDATEA